MCIRDSSYPISFSKGYTDLIPHTSGTNAEQALDRCKAKCFAFAWCLAVEVVLRDVWNTPYCRLVTDWNAYVVESANTFQENQWGGTQSIDGENYQTYCNGGSSPCSSSNVFDGGKLNSRDGYHCYLQTATWREFQTHHEIVNNTPERQMPSLARPARVCRSRYREKMDVLLKLPCIF